MVEVAGEFGNGSHSPLFQPFVAENVKVFFFFSDFRHSVTVFSFKTTDPVRRQGGTKWPGEPAHQACNISCQQSCDTGDAHCKLLFNVFSFCLYSQSLWSTAGRTKSFVNKRSDSVLSLLPEASEEKFNRGWDEQSVTSEMKLLTPRFLSFAALKRLWSQNILYPCRSLSLVTCGFQSSKLDTCYHANCFLWAICSSACSFFEPARLLPPSNLSSVRARRQMLFFRLAEGRYARVCCDCRLHDQYSFLPWNVNLMF